MGQESQKFGYDEAVRVIELIHSKLDSRGLSLDGIRDGLILGSGLGNFTATHMDKDAVKIPYTETFQHIDIGDGRPEGGVPGHAHELVIGPLKGTTDNRLVIAQSGREHPYEGVDTKRSTFWIRVMQLLEVETLIGSNASGILTPDVLKPPALMLVHSDLDFGWDNPLVGPNDPRLGIRFPHMGNDYPAETRKLVKRVARREGIDLKEGTYIRLKGPNYESKTVIYWLRNVLRGAWSEAKRQRGEKDFRGRVTGVVGMSSTFENMVAQHATVEDREEAPEAQLAFRRGRAYISTSTNYGAGLSAKRPGAFPNHREVKDNARLIQDRFGKLVSKVILELRKAA